MVELGLMRRGRISRLLRTTDCGTLRLINWLYRAVFALAAAGAGYVANLAGFPLPWMIGPLLLTCCTGLCGISAPRHRFYRPVGQLIVATAVGLYFTPDALDALKHDAVLMVGAAVLTIVAGFTTAIALRWLGKVDGTVAFFAAMPGGPNEMALLAERYGAAPAPVAFSQTLRIVFIVLLIPALLVFTQDTKVGPLVQGDLHWGGLALLYALAAAFTIGLKWFDVPNCNFIGPLAVGALIAATGTTLSAVPHPLLAGGQIMLGISLGAMFTREQIRRDRRFAIAAVLTTVMLLVQCAAVAALLWAVGENTLASYLLATAPGSVTEMALTAKVMQQGVAMVTAYHLTRIFIVIPLAPVLYWAFRYVMQRYMSFGLDQTR